QQGNRETSITSPGYTLNVQDNSNSSPTVVTTHFRSDVTGPALVLDLGAFGIAVTTPPPTVPTTYTFNSAHAAGNIGVTVPTTLDVTVAGGPTTDHARRPPPVPP